MSNSLQALLFTLLGMRISPLMFLSKRWMLNFSQQMMMNQQQRDEEAVSHNKGDFKITPTPIRTVKRQAKTENSKGKAACAS